MCASAPQHLDDAFLTPVLENDALLFGLDVDEAEFQDAGDDPAGGAAAAGASERGADSALAVENELLKLQARPATSRLRALAFLSRARAC